MKKFLPFIVIGIVFTTFFQQTIFKGLLPIPSDTIIGLYYPFRDLYASRYPNGIPYKNFLITDPVRQQYPWRHLVLSGEKQLQLPLWNPYSFGGMPLLANHQSAAFYPLNIIFFLLPFPIAWSVLVILAPILASVFMYLYLRHHKLHMLASILAAISYSFSGFFIAWLEWGTLTQVALWMPLLLLASDKVMLHWNNWKQTKNAQSLLGRKYIIWSYIFLGGLIAAFLGGHLQVFFYLFVMTSIYIVIQYIQAKNRKGLLLLFITILLLFLVTTFVQWYPLLKLITLSVRDLNQQFWNNQGWFIPWQNIIQFIAPDFLGNPATMNYWGIWNYAEFVGYIGIIGFVMAVYALITQRDKKVLFFGGVLFVSLLCSLPTWIAKLPFIFHIPFISTAQPTRLLFLIDFSLCVLAGYGFDSYLQNKRGFKVALIAIGAIFSLLWFFLFLSPHFSTTIHVDKLQIAKRNFVFPSIIFFILVISTLIKHFYKKTAVVIPYVLLIIAIIDIVRFGQKFTPFTPSNYLYPPTAALTFIQKQTGIFRIMTTDDRIFSPNFSVMYNLQSVEGYDPLFPKQYGEFIAASERNKPDISPQYGLNRILTPHNYQSKLIDLLGVQYILSLTDIASPKLEKVFQEGQTRVYKNILAYPRAFFVSRVFPVKSKNEAMQALFNPAINIRNSAVIECATCDALSHKVFTLGELSVDSYQENTITLTVATQGDSFLVFTDAYYPTWKVTVDGAEKQIVKTDYNFRGVLLQKGKHTIIFSDRLL